ncbi:MAG TPA: M1 family metallopeptidase [Chryseosolibacter sp.]|nr:M1 family metallopeptidase [Chryseosolibacter sp.]
MRLVHAGLFAVIALTAGCKHVPETKKLSMAQDPHSYSRPDAVKVKHLKWTATVDFKSKTIEATASWLLADGARADSLVLDTKDIHIQGVTINGESPADYRLGTRDPIFGQALTVAITANTKTVDIRYTTDPMAEALQWLTPEQTQGKKYPFLFTQSQAILARSWIPCQDTPGIRFTYEADVTVPPNLLALMSASNPQEKNSTGTYHFRMTQPVPSYLLALAAGDLSFAPISSRSGIYAEGSLINDASWEFADLEKMITAAEELYGPYRWERYDVLVLPPSFPFGGMENPRLTFATPTILAGDRSLTSLIAHELAHSWSGNLVTNATWNDFWLNEGFTVYFETRIMEKIYGADYSEMLASLNLQDLKDEIHSMREKGNYGDTRLRLDLAGRNPDEGVTDIAYNKGYYFLRSIEEKHGRDKFDKFLKDYFSDNAFGAMDTESFRKYIFGYYQSHFDIALDGRAFDEWILTEGLPANVPSPHSDRFQHVDRVLNAWVQGKALDANAANAWSTHEWLHFLKNLPEKLSQRQMGEVDSFGGFTASENAELLTEWGVISIRNNYQKMNPKIESFLIHTGRRKFLSPLYNELIKTDQGRKRARAIYEKARPNYHFVATSTFDKLLAS